MSATSTDIRQRFRRWLANKLASWARRIYPQSEEVMSFYMDRMVDFVLTGQSCVKVEAIPPSAMHRAATEVLSKEGEPWHRP